MAGRSQPCSYIGRSRYGAVTIVANRQAWQLFTKTFPDNSFFDSVYQRALETFVLSFFSIETLTTASFKHFSGLLILWAGLPRATYVAMFHCVCWKNLVWVIRVHLAHISITTPARDLKFFQVVVQRSYSVMVALTL